MWLFIVIAIASCVLADIEPPNRPQTLLYVRGPATAYSTFVNGLKTQLHHQITVSSQKEELVKFGERTFDNLIIFDANDDAYSVNKLLEFVDLGGNILVASDRPGKLSRALANKCGFDYDEQDTFVTSEANALDASHKIVAVPSSNAIRIDVNGKPIAYRGIGQARSQLTWTEKSFPVLTGDLFTYSYDAKQKAVETAGQELILVGALQSFNNARIALTGSSAMFSDELFALESCANEQFTLRLAAWTFGQIGRLKASNIYHHRIDQQDFKSPKQYTVNDTVVYHVDIQQFNGFENQWEPFVTDDIQLEFTMMDPYIRMPLKSVTPGHYSVTFTVPDEYGVFKFLIEYDRLGLSRLSASTTVPVHPKRHDEFERFVDRAFPYYVAEFSMMIGFILFAGVYLYHKD